MVRKMLLQAAYTTRIWRQFQVSRGGPKKGCTILDPLALMHTYFRQFLLAASRSSSHESLLAEKHSDARNISPVVESDASDPLRRRDLHIKT